MSTKNLQKPGKVPVMVVLDRQISVQQRWSVDQLKRLLARDVSGDFLAGQETHRGEDRLTVCGNDGKEEWMVIAENHVSHGKFSAMSWRIKN